jgi:hypothetical protein
MTNCDFISSGECNRKVKWSCDACPYIPDSEEQGKKCDDCGEVITGKRYFYKDGFYCERCMKERMVQRGYTRPRIEQYEVWEGFSSVSKSHNLKENKVIKVDNTKEDEKLIKGMIENRFTEWELDDITDYFQVLVNDLIKSNDRELAVKYVNLFEGAEIVLSKMNDKYEIGGENIWVYRMLFYYLTQALSLNFIIERLPGEIDIKQMRERMEELKGRC